MKVSVNVTTEDGWTSMRRWLAGHRRRLRLTQAEVARRMDVSPNMVSRLETGRLDPTMLILARYLHALELQSDFKLTPRPS